MPETERETALRESMTMMMLAFGYTNVIIIGNHAGALEIYSVACQGPANDEVNKVRKIIERALENEGIHDISTLN